MSRTKPAASANDAADTAVERRDFILRGLLAALGIPAGIAALQGCAGEAAIVGAIIDDGGITLTTQVNRSRRTLEDVQAAMGTAVDPTEAGVTDWLSSLNRAVDKVHVKARKANQNPLRANVESNMVEFLAALTTQGISLDYSGASPSFTIGALRQAAVRADTLLTGRNDPDRRALWIFVLGLVILNPTWSDVPLLAAAEAARQADQDDVGGLAYDRFFAPAAVPADQPAGQFPYTFEAALLVFTVMLPYLDTSPAMLLGPFYLVILIVAAIILAGLAAPV